MPVKPQYRMPFAMLAVTATIVAGGYLFSATASVAQEEQEEQEEQETPESQQTPEQKASFDRHFFSGLELMRAGRAADALLMLDIARKNNPEIPEVHVNIGYALLSLQRWREAYIAFEVALRIRPRQANAYYGMAEALEGQGKLEKALESMETYIHIADKNNPFLLKAEAAIRHWEEVLAETSSSQEPTPDTVENND
jgi:tetratricopeptide (TPR) repeat protein